MLLWALRTATSQGPHLLGCQRQDSPALTLPTPWAVVSDLCDVDNAGFANSQGAAMQQKLRGLSHLLEPCGSRVLTGTAGAKSTGRIS